MYTASCTVSQFGAKSTKALFISTHRYSTQLKSKKYADKNTKNTPTTPAKTYNHFLRRNRTLSKNTTTPRETKNKNCFKPPLKKHTTIKAHNKEALPLPRQTNHPQHLHNKTTVHTLQLQLTFLKKHNHTHTLKPFLYHIHQHKRNFPVKTFKKIKSLMLLRRFFTVYEAFFTCKF